MDRDDAVRMLKAITATFDEPRRQGRGDVWFCHPQLGAVGANTLRAPRGLAVRGGSRCCGRYRPGWYVALPACHALPGGCI